MQHLHLNNDPSTRAMLAGADGKRVDQYGPEWLAHVLAGGEVRYGNLLVGAEA